MIVTKSFVAVVLSGLGLVLTVVAESSFGMVFSGAGLATAWWCWPSPASRELHVPEVSRLVLYRQLQACKDELADLNEASKTFDEHRRVLDDNLADVRARLENVHAQLVHKDGGVYR